MKQILYHTNVRHTDKLQVSLDALQTHDRVRLVTPSLVADCVAIIETRLQDLLPKSAWPGLRFDCDPHGQSFPGNYEGRPMSTQFVLERGSKDWFVVGIQRTDCGGPTQRITPLNLGDKAMDIMDFLKQSKHW